MYNRILLTQALIKSSRGTYIYFFDYSLLCHLKYVTVEKNQIQFNSNIELFHDEYTEIPISSE